MSFIAFLLHKCVLKAVVLSNFPAEDCLRLAIAIMSMVTATDEQCDLDHCVSPVQKFRGLSELPIRAMLKHSESMVGYEDATRGHPENLLS